jgi:protein tyrosine/serine phosphatase
MRVNPSPFRKFFVALFALLAFSAAASAQEAKTKESFPQVKIKNFGQMDERLYRGAEPKKLEDFQALKELGVKTVIDLQAEPEPAERGMVESLGMTYVNIPMIAKKYPKSEHVAQFLKLVDDPATGKFFIHCAGGRHRTGVMGAVYRFNKYGWNYDQVYAEMKQFDFYTSWGHGDFKTFVQDYWQQVQTSRERAPVTNAATAVTATQQQQR